MVTGCVGDERRRAQPLRRPGEARAGGALGDDRLRARLGRPPRLQNTPSLHYVHCDQWRYERPFTDYHAAPATGRWRRGTRSTTRCARCATAGCRSTRSSTGTPLDVVRTPTPPAQRRRRRVVGAVVEAAEGARPPVRRRGPGRARELAAGVVHLARQRPHGSSAKGHEYFLKHYLGTRQRDRREEARRDSVKEVVWRDGAPRARWTSSST